MRKERTLRMFPIYLALVVCLSALPGSAQKLSPEEEAETERIVAQQNVENLHGGGVPKTRSPERAIRKRGAS